MKGKQNRHVSKECKREKESNENYIHYRNDNQNEQTKEIGEEIADLAEYISTDETDEEAEQTEAEATAPVDGNAKEVTADFKSLEKEDNERGAGIEAQSPADVVEPGSIHKEEVRAYWQDTLQADQFGMDILRYGYKLPFQEGCELQQYREENNKSAIKYIDFAFEETERWENKKVVKEVWKTPLCISPLTVAARMVAEAEKLRLCLDLSRYMNKLLRKEAVRLAGIDKCTQKLLPGDYIGTYDLTSAFHHVRIYEPHQQYLGFCLPGRKEGEKERYFIFLVMPFGLASAVKCITRMTKPLCGYISSKGIRHSIYIDDGNVLARALALVIAHLAFVLDALKQAGFVVSEGKTDTAETVSQVKLYPGFVLDLQKMIVRVSEEKLMDLRKVLQEVFFSSRRHLRCKGGAPALRLVALSLLTHLHHMPQSQVTGTGFVCIYPLLTSCVSLGGPGPKHSFSEWERNFYRPDIQPNL